MLASALSGCAFPFAPKDAGVADLDTVQRISYDASEEYEEALKKYNEGVAGVPVIRDDNSLDGKQIALIVQGAEDDVLVERAVELLEDHDIKASFAVTAEEAAEDDNTVKLISSKGHELIDNGLNGRDALERMSDEEILSDLASSRKIFRTLIDLTPDKLILDTPYYTENVRMAAKACGYAKVVSPSSGKYLNEKSFSDSTKAEEYVARLSSGSILVFKLNGIIDALELDPKTEYKKPAIDMQPTINPEPSEKENEIDAITVLTWLLDALESQECSIVKLDKLKALTDEEYVAQLIEENNGLKADEYTKVDTLEDVASIVFKGVSDNAEDMDAILEALKESGSGATFFLNKSDLDDYKVTVDKILEGGYSIAYRAGEDDDFSGMSIYEIYVRLKNGVRILQKDLSVKAKYYMPEVKASDDVRSACAIAGLGIVPMNEGLRKGKGNISCIDLTKDTDKDKIIGFIADSNKSGLKLVDVTTLLKAANSIPEIDEMTIRELRESNAGKLASQVNTVYTSEKAMSMIFYGVSNKSVVNDVLSILNARGYHATFFVTVEEITKCREQIESIVASGNEIGVAYIPGSEEEDNEFERAAKYILGAQKVAQWKYETDIKLVFQPYGDILDETREAVKATGCSLAGYEYALVHSDYKDATEVGSFYAKLTEKIDAHRGSIAYFNMNYFTADTDYSVQDSSTLLGNLLKRFIAGEIDSLTYKDVYGQIAAGTSYTVKSFSALTHSGYVYTPGRNGGSVINAGNSVLAGLTTVQEQDSYMASRYIGNPDVSRIPGFDDEEIKLFDTTGNVTTDKVIFLTFDDWGYEKDVNELLYVLDKYGVKGNFFVRTNNVHNNPNLLRAIAMDGHLIGSHSDTHMASWYVEQDAAGNYKYDDLTVDDALKLRNDVATSYAVLNRYCGDVVVNGRASLTTIYRPPTLAVSRLGMYQIFDVGYSYIVSGDFSTRDYEAASVDELVNELRNGQSTWYGTEKVENGTCLVMHMSPNAQFTAEALDIMIPEWLGQGYVIARLDDYLR